MIAEEEISAAQKFLAPVLDKKSNSKASKLSLIDRLGSNLPDHGENLRRTVIRRALHLLLAVHHALTKSHSADAVQEVLYDSQSRRFIDALLDLISLEGIYPNMCPGVGVPIDRRLSVFQSGIATTSIAATKYTTSKQDFELLGNIVEQLGKVVQSADGGLKNILQERIIVDLLAAVFQLAYHPTQGNLRYKVLLEHFWDNTPVSILFQALTSLVNPTIPPWLQPHLSTARACLPLRVDGVRQTIIFIANSMSQAKSQASAEFPNAGPFLSLEVLNQASRLLCSVPSVVSIDKYFTAIAPQLLALLDGDDVDMRRAASFVIGSGILGRRNIGAPGTVGWKLFAEPLIFTINRNEKTKGPTPNAIDDSNVENSPDSVITTADVYRAMDRVSALILIHPNPGLTKRFLTPLLLPIWGMICLAKEEGVEKPWVEQCFNLISTYLKISEGANGLIRLVDNLLWEGGHDWEYILDMNGNISVHRRPGTFIQQADADSLVSKIDLRLSIYEQLLDNSAVSDVEIGEVFMHITEHWLGRKNLNAKRLNLITEADAAEDPVTSLIYAKAAQGMLWKYKAIVAKQPLKLLHMIKQLLESYTPDLSLSSGSQQNGKKSKPSIAGLNSAISPQSEDNNFSHEISEDDSDITSACLSILSIILSSADSNGSIETSSLLISLQPTLSILGLPHSSLPHSTRLTALNISALITIHTSRDIASQASISPTFDQYSADRKTHSLVITYLGDSLPPVRAQGLSLLEKLIQTSSPVLDIPNSCSLLLSMLQDEEEFIYLSAIKSLELLSPRHSKTVVKMLMEQYVDHEEEIGLDQRLRIGEALLKTIENLGLALIGDIAKTVGEGVIGVAGRRGKRSKSLRNKQETAAKNLVAKKEAEDAWGGGVPQFDDGDIEDPVNERLVKVLETWESKEGEEDVRMRTSALSILGVAIDTNIAGMGSSMTSTAIDLAISILKFEIVSEKAILRRAAILTIMSLVRALDRAREEERQLGFGLAGESLEEVLKVLRYIEATDSDDIVKGHVREVIDGLGIWQSNNLLDIRRGMMQPDLIVNGRLAGLSLEPEACILSPPRIEEVE